MKLTRAAYSFIHLRPSQPGIADLVLQRIHLSSLSATVPVAGRRHSAASHIVLCALYDKVRRRYSSNRLAVPSRRGPTGVILLKTVFKMVLGVAPVTPASRRAAGVASASGGGSPRPFSEAERAKRNGGLHKRSAEAWGDRLPRARGRAP
jgi:hypothetical protein